MQSSNIQDWNFQKLSSRARYIASSAYTNGILESNLSSDRQQLRICARESLSVCLYITFLIRRSIKRL